MLHPVMNNTKWRELQLAMLALDRRPRWISTTTSGYRNQPDAEWYYHFSEGGYSDLLHVDILAQDDAHREVIRAAIRPIHLPGEETETGFRIFGYAQPGQSVDFLPG